MKWYTDRLKALESEAPILSVCGDDCAVCPRFLARTEEELHETALFWHHAGWRDHVVGNNEIRCTGCGCRPTCSFMLLPCTREHGVSACRDCPEFECDKVRDTYERSEAKKQQCESACDSPEEFRMLCRAFYEKEKNLRGVILETERLLLREMNAGDYDALLRVLGDPETMWHYPYTFDGQHVRDWIVRNMNRYRKDGFGLWAVCLKDTGEMIGDCGLTLQNIKGEILPEIGFHIRRDCQRKGYASEAAKAVRDWAFQNTGYPALYSYCKYTNTASIRTAESIGMRFACEYPDEVNGTTHVSVIARGDWVGEITGNMIRWAKNKLGSREYAGGCLYFIEDALEKGNGIEIFGGDSAKASCELYSDALRVGRPEQGAFVFYDCLCKADEGLVNRGHCGISLEEGKVIHAWDVVRIDDYRQIEAMTAPSGNHPTYLGWVPVDRALKRRAD